ncbi:MAG: carboxypeptidase-like regulatory domain-containing protein, partial [Phocaeicola sp.]
MKSILLTLLFILSSSLLFAQQTVTGRVIDAEDREPLARAMALVKRTEGGSLVKYVATDEEGNFNLSLSGEEMTTCMLHVTMMGYKPQMLPFSSEPMIVALAPAATELKEVIVKARKISSEGDTVRYHVASFADKQDRTIGDVMQKMPGIEVSQTGKIQYNGSDILRFYVEGKDLLGGKYNIATQGISPDDVGSVEILENHQPLRILQQVVSSSQASINLRLKE